MSEEVLQRAEERRVKGKRERGRDSHLNAEFQGTARRDKKVFLSEQCKKMEENNRIGKARDLFKKIGDIKGIFHARMGTIKDRNVVQKLLILIRSHLFIFAFISNILGVGHRGSCHHLCQRVFCLCSLLRVL